MHTLVLDKKALFTFDRKELEEHFSTYYEGTNNAEQLIQYAVAVLVKNAFSADDYSFLAKDLVRSVFLTRNDLHSVRQHCIHFREYFTNDEWRLLVARLFKNPEEFLDLTETARSRTEYLHPKLHSGCQEVAKSLDVTFVYKGKPVINKDVYGKFKTQESRDLLSILSSLRTFENEDVKDFMMFL